MADTESTTETESKQTHEPYFLGFIAEKDKTPYYRVKRWMDVAISATLLFLLSPLLLIIAVVIKLDSPGPVIFRQVRVGYDWRRKSQTRFVLYKFRSMYDNCDQNIHREHIKAWVQGKVNGHGASSSGVKLTEDPRVTRFGQLLRKTSLDELPQLWNVFLGDMSLVGPRPVPPYEVSEYQPWHYQRLLAPAGITGLWQIRARGQVGLDDMARLDIEYIDRQSLWFDLYIMLFTVPVVLSRQGAK